MSWFGDIWNSASDEGRKAASELTSQAEAATDIVKRDERRGMADAQKIIDYTGKQVAEEEQKAKDEAVALETKTRELAQTANEKAASAAQSIYRSARGTFEEVKDGLIKMECRAISSLAFAGGNYLASPRRQWLQDRIGQLGRQKDQDAYDGKIISDGCQAVDSGSARALEGIRPDNCPRGKIIPKITFVNGILTKFQDGANGSPMCQGMKQIANASCAEVVGVYNATEGAGSDLEESLGNIKKLDQSPSTHTLSEQIQEAVKSDQPMVIYAHSQGGLIAQDALADARNNLMYEGMTQEEAQAALSKITVRSFGTAESGWPIGPQYTHVNNAGDPVPALIAGAQQQYAEETNSDSDPTPTTVKPVYFANPLGAHYLNAYVPAMGMEPGPRNCDCK